MIEGEFSIVEDLAKVKRGPVAGGGRSPKAKTGAAVMTLFPTAKKIAFKYLSSREAWLEGVKLENVDVLYR